MRVAAPHYPALEAALEELGAAAITASEGDAELFAEPGVATAGEWHVFTLTALFEGDVDRTAVSRRVRGVLGLEVELVFTALVDQVWAESWKTHWQPQEFANGLWVCPTWCTPPVTARHVLRLDPGRAFGTGTHESTALCLDWLAHAALAGKRVIDYGCGSGILALAAACFGAAQVSAVDIDDDALMVARDNIAINGMTGRIQVANPEVLSSGGAEVLVANILAEPLLALAPTFATLLVPGAMLALAGLLVPQAPRVAATYAAAGFTMASPQTRGDWALLCGIRR